MPDKYLDIYDEWYQKNKEKKDKLKAEWYQKSKEKLKIKRKRISQKKF